MKNIFAILFVINFCSAVYAQKFSKTPESKMSQLQVESQIRFLASDEMLGRKTGSITNNVAARYLAEQFREAGLKTANGQADYLQQVPLETLKSLKKGSFYVNADTVNIGKGFVAFAGSDNVQLKNIEVVFAAYGWVDAAKGVDDYKDLDVKGKIVITRAGTLESQNPQELFSAANTKRKIAKEKGALAVIEIFGSPIPWPMVSGYFNGENISLLNNESGKRLPLYWLNGQSAKNWTKDLVKTVSIDVPARERSASVSNNVVATLEGSDPVLKNEYIVLSAHFDHIGYGIAAGKIVNQDSIFNGTRDNAFGCIGLIQAAKSLSALRPKRSILFVAFTGEEVGLLGSKYYTENPMIPLNKCVFNLNCDGAGYNDTTAVTIIGLSRTDAKKEIETAASIVGLRAMDDPAPEQGLFDRSDNVHFAAKGIPAPTYSQGFTAFDEAIQKYYHQSADNPETISMSYLKKYLQVYVHAARLIANRSTAPMWIKGDKYEKAFKELFKK